MNVRRQTRYRLSAVLTTFLLSILFVYQLEYDLRSYYTEFVRTVHEYMSPEETNNQLKQPVLVTGFSADHFDEAQGLIRSIHRYLPQYRLVVYDLGLEAVQRYRLVKYCRCEVRTFESSRYPPHVRNLTTYAFKPLCISEVFDEAGFVFWIDASVRFKSSRLSPLLAFVESIGYAASEEDNPISCLTHPSMFQYFNVADVSLFQQRREVVATYLVLFATPLIKERIVNPWKKCAMEQQCIAPDGHRLWICDFKKSPDYCGCHRYDQSALGILVYQMQNDSSMVPSRTWPLFGGQPHKGYLGSSHSLSPMYDILDLRRTVKENYFPH